MNTPLPVNIEPDGFVCLPIWIPNDRGYRQAVMGAVSYLGNWFAWERDEYQSGKRAAAKFREAYSLTVADAIAGKSCSENDGMPPVDTDEIEIIRAIGAQIEVMMNVCGYNPKAFKLEGGKLYVKDFCGEWVAVDGEFQARTEEIDIEGGNPTFPEDDPPTTYSLCGKAAQLINALDNMVQAALLSYGVPGDFEENIRASVPNSKMSRANIYLLLVDMVAARKTYSEETIRNDELVALMKCKAAKGMIDSPDVVYEEYSFVANSIKSACFDTYPYVTADIVFTIWEQCYETLGYQDCILQMSLGVHDTVEDCECPSIYDFSETDPFGYCIYTGATNMLPAAWGFEYELVNPSTIIVDFDVPAGTYKQVDNITFTFAKVDFGIQELEITTRVLEGPRFPTSEWQEVAPIPPQYWGEYNNIDGSTIVNYKSPGVSVAVHKWAGQYKDMDGKFAVYQNLRMSPFNDTPAVHYKMMFQITYSGPLRGV